MNLWKKISLGLFAIVFGIFVAKLHKTTFNPQVQSKKSNALAELILKNSSVDLVQVGEYVVTSGDLKWELENHVAPLMLIGWSQDISDNDKRFLKKDLNDQVIGLVNSSSSPLVQSIFLSLLERKLVFEWIVKHSVGFEHSDSQRYIECVENSRSIASLNPDLYKDSTNRKRLKNKFCEQAIIQQYINEVILSHISIPESEIKQGYMTKYNNQQKSPKVIFAQILVGDEVTASKLKKTATKDNFGALAMDFSLSPEGLASKGKIGPFSREQLPQLFEILFEMEQGTISNIIKSDYGYHLFHLIYRYQSGIVPYEQARNGIIDDIKRKRLQLELDKLVDLAMNVIRIVPDPNL